MGQTEQATGRAVFYRSLTQISSSLCGRDTSYLVPPAQIRTCGFPASGLYGALFVKGASRHFCRPFVIPFFCLTRAASILPSRLHISIAVARSGGQGRCFFSSAEGLSLTDVSTAAGSLAIGWLAAR